MDQDGGFRLPALREVKIEQGLAAGLCGPGYGGAEDRQELVLDDGPYLRPRIVIGGVTDETDKFVFEVHRISSDWIKRSRLNAKTAPFLSLIILSSTVVSSEFGGRLNRYFVTELQCNTCNFELSGKSYT
jgi:hypothetical protein